MKLKKLVKDLSFQQVKGSKDIDITGISSHSKTVGPGNVFVARKGLKVDGGQFIEEAISNGAVAIVTDIYNPFLKGVTQLIHQNPSQVAAYLAKVYYQNPSQDLFLVGVTGTNGKTSLSYMVKKLLELQGAKCGLIGTVEYVIGPHHYEASHTTPDITLLQKYLKKMQMHQTDTCIMEVSSHALDQGRVDGLAFDCGIFTNLSREHLDYHKTMENYYRAKKLLFDLMERQEEKKVATACINSDDPYGRRLVEELTLPVKTYGLLQGQVRAKDLSLRSEGSSFTLCYRRDSWQVHTPLLGRFNIYNLLALFAFGFSQNIPIASMLEVAATITSMHGRMEKVENALGIQAYVDYAHTPDALEKVLKTFKEVTTGRVVVVFGCGGERDKGKRPLMGKVAEGSSDYCILTSDNSRGEDPKSILQHILQGVEDKDRFTVQEDRRLAIRLALQYCNQQGDCLLVAGKGHENTQLFANHGIPFDDREVIQEEARHLTVHS